MNHIMNTPMNHSNQIRANKYQLSPGILAQFDLPEIVLLDSNSGRYFELNDSGSEFLRALHLGADVQSACATVIEQFSAPANQVEADCLQLLDALVEQKLVHLI